MNNLNPGDKIVWQDKQATIIKIKAHIRTDAGTDHMVLVESLEATEDNDEDYSYEQRVKFETCINNATLNCKNACDFALEFLRLCRKHPEISIRYLESAFIGRVEDAYRKGKPGGGY
jgi:hypothetical protein